MPHPQGDAIAADTDAAQVAERRGLVRSVSQSSQESERPLRLARLRSDGATPRSTDEDQRPARKRMASSTSAASSCARNVTGCTPATAAAGATTLLDSAARSLFGLQVTGGFDDHMTHIRELMGQPSFWTKSVVDTTIEKLGSGTYGTVYRGARADGRGEVAVKHVQVKTEGMIADAVREFLVQQIVYDCYDRSASRECWAPVHHPFPTLYGVAGHRTSDGTYQLHASMFLFQRGAYDDRSVFQTLLQVSAVLCHLNTATSLRFMHRDLHWNNVMRRKNSKHLHLPLFRTAKGWFLQSEEGAVKKIFQCGPEIAMIDFGLAWLQLPNEGEVIQPLQSRVYDASSCSIFNTQHDLRLLCVSLYSQLCIDEDTLTPRKGKLGVCARFVRTLVETARSQSKDFQLSTSLSTLRYIRTHLRTARDKHNMDFDAWIRTGIAKPFLTVQRGLWETRYIPFIQGYSWIWSSVWANDSMPALAHFQYGQTVRIVDTPCFEPESVLSAIAEAWKW